MKMDVYSWFNTKQALLHWVLGRKLYFRPIITLNIMDFTNISVVPCRLVWWTSVVSWRQDREKISCINKFSPDKNSCIMAISPMNTSCILAISREKSSCIMAVSLEKTSCIMAVSNTLLYINDNIVAYGTSGDQHHKIKRC